jgi:hypothetical protein
VTALVIVNGTPKCHARQVTDSPSPMRRHAADGALARRRHRALVQVDVERAVEHGLDRRVDGHGGSSNLGDHYVSEC